jgi:hypothetical protein
LLQKKRITWLYLTLVWTSITFGKIVNTSCMIYKQVIDKSFELTILTISPMLVSRKIR